LDNFYAKYSGVGGGGGVSSINAQTGALTLVGANGITVSNVGAAFTITGTTENAISQLTGDVTAGPAVGSQSVVATLTATTNSTLTTLSALSLPGSQVTGTVPAATTAGNITATSNSTLTTLSALSLPASQVTGLSSLYATTTLNNLGTTAISADLLPGSYGTVNLGNGSLPYNNIVGKTLYIYDSSSNLIGGLTEDVAPHNLLLEAIFPGNGSNLGSGIEINTANSSGNGSGSINLKTGDAPSNYNSGSFNFTAGSVSGSGVQGSFNVTASSIDINGVLMIDNANGEFSFVSISNNGHLANGPAAPILISTGSEITAMSGNTNITTGSVTSVFEFLETSFSGTLVPGDVYSVAGVNYTFISNVDSAFYFSSSAAGLPPVSGTLTKVSSAGGPATIPYSNSTQSIVTSGNTNITTGSSGPYANTGNVVIAPGTPGTGGVQGSVFIRAPTLNLTGTNVLQLASTVTPSGTDGAQTINKASGTVNFAPAATSLVVTNSLVTANSLVFATIRTNDATATIKNVVPAAGSFTINLSAAATAETSVGFFVINQ
jgi:hypothetical protein